MPEQTGVECPDQQPEMNTEEIIRFIKESKKRTPVHVFVSGKLKGADWRGVTYVGGRRFGLLTGDWADVMAAVEANRDRIEATVVEVAARNSAVPLVDLTRFEARIEPGAIIRDRVSIGKGAVIMMGAVIAETIASANKPARKPGCRSQPGSLPIAQRISASHFGDRTMSVVRRSSEISMPPAAGAPFGLSIQASVALTRISENQSRADA